MGLIITNNPLRVTRMAAIMEGIRMLIDLKTMKKMKKSTGITKKEQKYVLLWFFADSIDDFEHSDSARFYEMANKNGWPFKEALAQDIEQVLETIPFETIIELIRLDYNLNLNKESDFIVNTYRTDNDEFVDIVFSIKDLCLKSIVDGKEIMRVSKDLDSKQIYNDLVSKTDQLLA